MNVCVLYIHLCLGNNYKHITSNKKKIEEENMLLLLGMLFDVRFMKRFFFFGLGIYGCEINHYQVEHRYRSEFRCFM